jgi:hypothetical protein
MGILGGGREAADDATAWLWTAAGDTLGWIGDRLADTAGILTALWPPILAGIAAIVVLRTVRLLLLLWRGRTPRVQISNFAWATSDNADREATWVTSLFREQLAALRLDALDPLPDRAPGAPLVEIVEGVGQGLGRLDLGKAIGRLFRAVWPDSAYEVWGTLRPREGGKGGRISVQLIERRRGNRTLLNVALEQGSWQEGAEEAAMAVAGALYPRVRKRDRGPWTMWNETVPRQLMSDYHAGRRYEEENRPEHALAAYHAALEQDPLNPNLRLKIAMLQERLELNLDAWVTYQAVASERDKRTWRGPDRRVHMLAVYRLAVMLSNGRVAEQWVKHSAVAKGQGTRRDDERRKRREELLVSLECDSLLTKTPKAFVRSSDPLEWAKSLRIVNFSAGDLLLMVREIDSEIADIESLTGLFGAEGDDDRRKPKIDAVLQILALQWLEELDAWSRTRPPERPWQWREWWIHRPVARRWLRRGEFSRAAIRTSKLLVRIRLAASLENMAERCRETNQMTAAERDRWKTEIRDAYRVLTMRWPFPPFTPWRWAMQFLAPRRRWSRPRDDAWQLHYNAACVAAAVLRDDSVPSVAAREGIWPEDEDESLFERLKREAKEMATRDPLTKLRPTHPKIGPRRVIKGAIAQLEEYAYRAGSHRVAAQVDWLAIDDPDLRGLRKTDEFKLWASHHLPGNVPVGLPSRKADVKRFMARVLHQGACAFAESWWERTSPGPRPASEVNGWWQVEEEIWQLLSEVCREHLSWQQRRDWLDRLREWLQETGFEDKIDFSHEARGVAAADSLPEELFDMLAGLAGAPDDAQESGAPPDRAVVLGWVKKRTEHVRAAIERGERRAGFNGRLRAEVERDEALRAARIWTQLAETLEEELNRHPPNLDQDEHRSEEEKAELKADLERKHARELEGKLDKIRELLPAA